MTRSRDWDDVVTTHAGSQFGRAWTVRDKRMSSHTLTVQPDRTIGSNADARSSCVSACGNFGLVGSNAGKIEMYNLQSGIHRRTFDTRAIDADAMARARLLPAGTKKRQAAEEAARTGKASPIIGIATDARNRICVATTLSGHLHYFDFFTTDLLSTTKLPSSAAISYFHRDSNLLAVACDDLTVQLFDVQTERAVREFAGFRGRVLDLSISSDARWLMTTSMDSVIRTFDIPTGRLIDTFRTPSIATSLSISPSLDFLATAHVDSIGVYLWANRAQFSSVALRGIDELAEVADGEPELALPGLQETDASADGVDDEEGEALHQLYTSPQQLFIDGKEAGADSALTTFSNLPRSRWLTLINFDAIKARDKPIEPVKAPEKAPFFLPQVAGLESSFDTTQQSEKSRKGKKEADTGRLLSKGGLDFTSDFIKRLQKAKQSGNGKSCTG